MEQSGYYGELNLDGLTAQIQDLFPDFSIDLNSFLGKILEGKAGDAFRELFGSIRDGLWAQIDGMRNLMLLLLIIGILSALFTVVMQTFRNHQIAEIAHFVSYLLLLLTVISAFSQASDEAARLLERILLFVRLFVPTFMLALGFCAGTATAAGYYQLILLLIYIVEQLLLIIGLPMVNLYMLLVVMNGIWEEERLTTLLELVQKTVVGALKFLLTCITGIGVLQSMITPVLENLKLGTASKVLSAIPGLGGLAEGTTQLLLGSAVLIKNGLGVAAILLLLLLCVVPLLKLFVYGGILKLCAGLMGLAADKRLTGCVNAAGDAMLLLLRISGTAAACFLILFAVITCLAGTV